MAATAERLRRLRAPVAVLALIGLAGQLLLALGGFLYYAVVAGVGSGIYVATSQATLAWGLVVLLAVGAAALWGEPIPRARLLTLLAAIALATLALVSVVFGLVGVLIGDGALRMVGAVIDGLVVGLLAVVMAVVHHQMPVRRGDNRPGVQLIGPPQSAPPTQPMHPPAQGFPNQWQQQRSQTDQFGNPHADYRGDNSQNSANSGSGDWQPAAQQPPHRLEPSPNRPPVGPHQPPPAANPGSHPRGSGDDDHGRTMPDPPGRQP